MTALNASGVSGAAAAPASELPASLEAPKTRPQSQPQPQADPVVAWRQRWRWACAALVVITSGLWLIHLQLSYARWGLFRWIGVDWGAYYAQSPVLLSVPPEAIYDLAALRRAHQALSAYTTDPTIPMMGGHVPYVPLFAWLFVPFAVVPPPIGLLVWTGLQAV